MKISQAGVDAIKRHEGLRLWAYLDSASVPTIGYGHTSGVRMGDHIDEATAEVYLRADLSWVEAAVNNNVRVELTQGQYDALCSLVFNIGEGAFKKSTLLERLNAGEYEAAADEFLRWDKATVNGVKEVLPGLARRRVAERSMFLATTTPLAPENAATATPGPSAPPSYTAPRPDAEPYVQQEAAMPIPAIVGALLPSVIDLIPKLGGLFGSGSKVAERNVAAATAVFDILKTSTQATNEQQAVERMKSDPAALQAATKAVEARWYELTEAGGGGIDGARKADAAAVANGDPVYRSPSFIVALALLPLVYMVVGAIVGLFGTPFSEDVRAAIANGIVGLILGGLIGYYYGQSTSRNRSTAPA